MRFITKKVLSLVLVLTMLFSFMNVVFADNVAQEEYEPGVTVIKDEESPTGYVAKFVYIDAEAESVYLQGDTMYFADKDYLSTGKLYTPYEWEKGMYPISGVSAIAATETTPAIPAVPKYNVAMTKVNDDTWTVSVPLPSGAYKYCYYVNGNGTPSNGTKVLDPANLPLLNTDTDKYANFSIVYMPFDEEKQDDDRSYMLPRDGENGSLVFESVTGEINGQERTAPFVVYLPYGYDVNREEPYKVLYVLHGGGGHERDWPNDGTMPNIMDNMIAEGVIEPTIVVAITYSGLGGSDSTLPTIMAQLQGDYIIPLMESKYNASTEVSDRAFAGLSQGGLTTSYMMVNAVAGIGPQYGTYGIWSAKSVPVNELEAYKDDADFLAELRKLNIVVDTGIEDLKHYNNSVALVAKLEELGANVYEPTYPDGGHDWMLWPKLLYNFTHILWSDSFSIIENDTSETAETNGEITIKAKTNADDIIGFFLKNENDKAIKIISAVSQDNGDGSYIWEIKTSVGTVGNRILTLYPVSTSLGIMNSHEIAIEVVPAANAYEVIDAKFGAKAVNVNAPVNVEVKTGSKVSQIAILNEKGAKMGKKLVSKTSGSDGTITWVYTITIGTAGMNRQFTVFANNADGVYESNKTISIAVV